MIKKLKVHVVTGNHSKRFLKLAKPYFVWKRFVALKPNEAMNSGMPTWHSAMANLTGCQRTKFIDASLL